MNLKRSQTSAFLFFDLEIIKVSEVFVVVESKIL